MRGGVTSSFVRIHIVVSMLIGRRRMYVERWQQRRRRQRRSRIIECWAKDVCGNNCRDDSFFRHQCALARSLSRSAWCNIWVYFWRANITQYMYIVENIVKWKSSRSLRSIVKKKKVLMVHGNRQRRNVRQRILPIEKILTWENERVNFLAWFLGTKYVFASYTLWFMRTERLCLSRSTTYLSDGER